MKVLRSWLQDHVDIKISDDELAEKIVTVCGADIDVVKHTLNDNIIVVEILEVKPHPNADRLKLATVFDGGNNLEIVCGAPNIATGQKVPLARIGAIIQGHEITRANIRGVESNGMLCSEKELGIGGDHDGIKILPTAATVGELASKYLPSDRVLDLEITPNRGDCLSHLGIAREIAAFTNQEIKPSSCVILGGAKPSFDHELRIEWSPGDLVAVEINDPDLCPRYCALEISGLKISPSPEWLQGRLNLLGAKPINNVVDATNYIMLDLGQPLHAFDADKIEGKKIVSRRAKDGETLVTLDEKLRELNYDMLVIADSQKPIALAGIMGGIDSAVTTGTTNIILEAAEFEPKNIRKTSKTLGLASDASYRFERGIDSAGIEYALSKAAKLIVEIAGGTNGTIVKSGQDYESKTIQVEYSCINRLLGLDLQNQEIDKYLTSLDFKVNEGSCLVPSWRHDIEIWQDLAEEVGRMYGYDIIPVLPVSTASQPSNTAYNLVEHNKDLLAKIGFVEVKNYPFLSEADVVASKIPTDELLEVANPVQSENKYLRNSCIPSLLKDVAKNSAFDPVLIFEIGNIFSKNDEKTVIGLAASGKNAKASIEKAGSAIINLTDLPQDFIKITELPQEEISRFKVRKDAVYVSEIPISEILEHLKVPKESLSFQLSSRDITFRPVSHYPSISRDIAMIVDASVAPDSISDSIYKVSPLIILIELFDEFLSDKFGQNKKSLTFHLFLQHTERTLTIEEADGIMNNIISMLQGKHGAQVR